MNILINRMEISGFKGINALKLTLDGKSAVISGDNGTGKTSVYDAFLWLLTGKDSTGANADVKPLDEHGNRVVGLDCDVEAELHIETGNLLTDRIVTLHRQLHEVWSKNPAGGDKIYSRDETLCWIDGVPKKVDREYTPEVIAMFGSDEGNFKLLTSYTAFMAQHWTDRRRVLLALTDVTDIIPGFEDIESVLEGSTPEDAKKRLQEQRKRHEDQLKTIPARIDELQRVLLDLSGEEYKRAKKFVEQITTDIETIDRALSSGDEFGKRVNEIASRKAGLLRQKDAEENRLRAQQQGEKRVLREKSDRLWNEITKLKREQANAELDLEDSNNELKGLEEKRKKLLDEYHTEDAKQYEEPDNIAGVCPTCGQPLPQEQVWEARSEHRKAWENDRFALLERIKNDGMRVKEVAAKLAERIPQLQGEIEARSRKIADLVSEREAVEKEGEAVPSTLASPEIDHINAEIMKVDAELSAVGTDDQAEGLQDRKRKLNVALGEHNRYIAEYEANQRNRDRVAELEAEKSKTGIALAEVERKLYRLGQYVSARCKLLEESINDHFDTICWKLFDIQKNGEIRDVCDATVNGVPYGSGLNNAAEINAGIEIIRVLSEAMGISAPCFVDNAESVNRVAQTGGQMILLTVTDDPELVCTLMDE